MVYKQPGNFDERLKSEFKKIPKKSCFNLRTYGTDWIFFTHLKISIGFLTDLAAFKYSGRFANSPNSEDIMKRFPKIHIVF